MESRAAATATHCLPATRVFNFYEQDEGEAMEFRLVYGGPLPPERWNDAPRNERPVGRAKDKHRLRKHFHHQLRELWKQDPMLRQMAESWYVVRPGQAINRFTLANPDFPGAKNFIEHTADDHARCNGRFVPLISTAGGFSCALDILFLRRDVPGNLIANGGDIDSRIKVLLDGLRMPGTVNELGGFSIDQEDENPFYCLLEDDKLISQISVTTDRLITPQKAQENENDVMLVIHVTMINPVAIFAGGRLP